MRPDIAALCASALLVIAGAVIAAPAPAVDVRLAPTASPAPPTVESVVPGNGSSNVSVATWIVVTFSATMNRTATVAGFSYTDGVAAYGGGNGTVSWAQRDVVDDTMVFNPDDNLRTSAVWTVRLNASAVRDAEGSLLDGNRNGTSDGSPADDVVWNFIVEAADTTAPTVTAADPANGTQGVSVVAPITITFSESMNPSSVLAGFSYTDGTTTFTVANGTGSWSMGDEVYAFTPTQSFPYGEALVVTLNGSTVEDLAGNVLDGDGDGVPGDNFTLSFETETQPDTTRPEVVSTNPSDGAIRVGRFPTIEIVFSEAMNRATVQAAIAISGGVTVPRFTWPNPSLVTFSPSAALAYQTPYTVIVFTTARDLAGNQLAESYTFAFTTTGWVGPVTGQVRASEGHEIANATVSLGLRTLRTGATGTFRFEGVEAGTYPLAVSKEGYASHASNVLIDENSHDLGVIALEDLAVEPGALPWVLVAGVVVVAVALLLLLWRRPKVEEPAPRHWRPAEAVVIPQDEERPKP